MSNEPEITLTIKHKCQCGHVWKEIMELRQGKQHKYDLHTVPVPLINGDPEMHGGQLEFTGRVMQVSIEEIDVVVGRGVICRSCGETLQLYGEKYVDSDEQEKKLLA